MKSINTKVLVVDDDVDIVYVVKILLTAQGFEVITRNSGQYFLKTVKEIQPHIILLDVQLGDSDGRHLCRELKISEAHKHIKVILFTANPAYAQDLHEYLCDGFIEKPFEIHHLVATIRAFPIAI